MLKTVWPKWGNYELSSNPYDPDSTSNPNGRWSKYSPDSINNPYGAGNHIQIIKHMSFLNSGFVKMTIKRNANYLETFFCWFRATEKSVLESRGLWDCANPKRESTERSLIMFWVSSAVYILILAFFHFSNSSNRLDEVLALDVISAVIFLPLYLFFCHGAYKISKTFSYKTLSYWGAKKRAKLKVLRVELNNRQIGRMAVLFKVVCALPQAPMLSCF